MVFFFFDGPDSKVHTWNWEKKEKKFYNNVIRKMWNKGYACNEVKKCLQIIVLKFKKKKKKKPFNFPFFNFII
jgi:hypothetical protein